MYYERGPRGKIHAPAYQDGCYRRRLTDCCLFCMGRVVLSSATASLRYRIRNGKGDENHDLVGETVQIPYVDHSATEGGLDYREGTIKKVYLLSGDDPALLTVATEEGEQIHIDLMPEN